MPLRVQLQVQKLYCVSRSTPELPLQLEDASRSEAALAADPELPRVNQDVRLNNRIIDLRTPANQVLKCCMSHPNPKGTFCDPLNGDRTRY